MANALPKSGFTPSLVLIGVPSQKALERVIQKLDSNSIEFSAFYEPDHALGLTAVATVPLTAEQRAVLSNYKVFSHTRSSVGRAPLQSDGGPRFESARVYQDAQVA